MKQKETLVKSNESEALIMRVEDFIEAFRENFAIGMASVAKAAKNYADALLRHPSVAKGAFREAFPGVSEDTWGILEKIGMGDLQPQAFYLPRRTVARLTHIPVEKQKRIFEIGERGFKVVSPATMKTTIVPLQGLSAMQASLVIDETNGSVRTEEEQKRIIRNQKRFQKKAMRSRNEPDFEIVGSVCRIGGVEIGRETLRRILAEMDNANKTAGGYRK